MQLREYQSDTIEKLRDGFRAGHKRQILSASTGAGKSVIMLEMVRAALEKGTRSIFICERRNLVDQFSTHLEREGIDHGIMMAGSFRFRPQELVQIASAQTLERMEAWPDFTLAFVDEIHASMRKSIIQMFDTRPGLRVVGATATPFHPLLPKYFSNVVSAPSMEQLVDMGFLVPYRVFVAKEVDTRGVHVVAGEWQKDELEDRGRKIVGDIVADYLRLSNDVFGRKSKAICFSCGIAHGTELEQSFQAAGINAVQLASGVDEQYKSDALREFAKPDSSIDMLISVDMLSRGFDQTDIEHVILSRPLKKSFSQHIQQIGRGARSHEGKSLCVVQDHTNNFLRFRDEWEKFFSEGVTELSSEVDKKPKKEPTELEKKQAKCPVCGALWPGSSDTCLNCGHTREKRNSVTEVPGEMLELSGSKSEKYDSATKEAWYRQLLGYARTQGKKDGWAWYQYQAKFGVKPPWRKEIEIPSYEVIQWIRSRNIAWAKRNGA